MGQYLEVSTFIVAMEEPGEQGTVVFALICTEPASECVCGRVGGGERGCYNTPPHPVP
jgi:hypothetical protein